nr:CoA transferase [Agrobacterium leguminum]
MTGARVIESSAFIAAPLCGLLLSQFGADVIRIDNIGGGIDYNRMPRLDGGRSLYWTSLNKNKRSIAINLRSTEGREIVRNLVTAPGPQGGTLLTNVAASWLSHSQLSASRQDVISCTVEGNFDGSTAVDYTVQAATGYPYMTGSAEGELVNNPLPAWDVICAHHAATATIAAIVNRIATGSGAEIRIALSDIAFSTLSHLGMLTEATLLPQSREATGNFIFGAFGRDFETADGRRVMVAAISSRQWASLVDACQAHTRLEQVERECQANFAREEDRFLHRESIAAVIEDWCKAKAYSEVAEAFDGHKVCWGTYQTIKEAAASDIRASVSNPMFQEVMTPGIGNHSVAGSAIRESAHGPANVRPAPYLGNDTREVLGQVLGIGTQGYDDLINREIVAGPEKDPYYAG